MPNKTNENKNKALNKAAKAKQDEFYTQLSDIENELRHYRAFFKGKTVFCNCDDPYESNFFKYFALNFNQLGLKKLIATCYAGSPVAQTELPLFDLDKPAKERKPYKAEMTEFYDFNRDGRSDLEDVKELLKNNSNIVSILKSNGDFRSEECIELLKQADVVVTNPPFSLFREFVAQLMEYKKDFLIIGNQNNVTYKDIFSLIQQNKIWLGFKYGDMAFKIPDYYEARETRFWIDESGQKWRSFGTICWFTNIDHEKRHEKMFLFRNYSPEKYPKYDNYDAIEVNKATDIPCDYDGVMGVPITFLDKYNPDQFEIIGCTANGLVDEKYKLPWDKPHNNPFIDGKAKYQRILIRRK